MKNAYAAKIQEAIRKAYEEGFKAGQKEAFQNGLDSGRKLFAQYCMDTFQIALHSHGCGYKKIKAITDTWGEVYRYYFDAMKFDFDEADVLREKMDRVMKEICKNHQEVIRFENRYPELKAITYLPVPSDDTKQED